MANKRKRSKKQEAKASGEDLALGARGGSKSDPEEGSAIVEWGKSIFFAGILFLVFRSFLIQTFVITSGSMENTLLVGDFLMVNRAAIGSRIPLTDIRIPGYSTVEQGDILVFDPPHEENLKLVKRLIGMPGDVLEMRDKVLYRNGEAQDEPYVVRTDYGDQSDGSMLWQREHLVGDMDPAEYRPTRDTWGPIRIPEGSYFMLGDNRDTSLDSRYWGLLDDWRLEGRAVVIYFSYNKGSFKPFPWIREVRPGRIGQLIR
ncbi:MAG: signal peptidase I [Longimicrobiales bacterium]